MKISLLESPKRHLNIAEGNGRFTKREQKRFYDIAHGSLFECIAILDICKDCSYLSEQDFNKCESKAYEVLALLNGLIKYVKS